MFACSETTSSLLVVHILTLPHKGVTHQSKMEGKSLLYITFLIVSHFDGAGVVENTPYILSPKKKNVFGHEVIYNSKNSNTGYLIFLPQIVSKIM